MTRADLVHALSLLPEEDAIGCVVAAGRLRAADSKIRMSDDDIRNLPEQYGLIVRACASAYGVGVSDLMSSSRTKRVCSARNMAYRLVLDLVEGANTVNVARYFGRHHTTVSVCGRSAAEDESPQSMKARCDAVDALLECGAA